MKVINHNIEAILTDDLERKMVFLSGPRQVGKTTLAKKIMRVRHGRYLLYDDLDDRESILKRDFLRGKYVCLDEFHKYARWKSLIKGIFDKYRESLHILITGSSRLDCYQKSGDSLTGRYYLHALHPLSLKELHSVELTLPKNIETPHPKLTGLNELMKFGGFPEPFLSGSESEHRRWSRQRRGLLLNEELRELTQIQLLSVAENLMILLNDKIGALLSATALSEDLRISVPTVLNWLAIFERLYIVFRILPFSTRISRSLRKMPKLYLWDWSQIISESVRFENCVASHLFKAVSYWNALGLTRDAQLYFLRDRLGRETDFLVTKNRKPWFAVEAKLAEDKIDHSLRYFCDQLDIPGIQLILRPGMYKKSGPITVISADTWLGHLV